jgi:cell division protein FtsL
MNRKSNNSRKANRILNRLILYSLTSLALVGGFGVLTVWMRHQTSQTANRLHAIEQKIVEERRSLSQLDVQLAIAMSTDRLMDLNRKLNLDLREPVYTQIVHVTENVESRLYEKSANSVITASLSTGN